MSDFTYVYMDTGLDDDINIEVNEQITLGELLNKIAEDEPAYVQKVRSNGKLNLKVFELNKPHKLFRESTLLPEPAEGSEFVYISATEDKEGGNNSSRLRLSGTNEGKKRYTIIPTIKIEGIDLVIDDEVNKELGADKKSDEKTFIVGSGLSEDVPIDSMLEIIMDSGKNYLFDDIENLKIEICDDGGNKYRKSNINDLLNIVQ